MSMNLQPQRGPSVWDRKSYQTDQPFRAEPWATGITAAVVSLYGLSRGWRVLPLASGVLAYRAATGRDDLAGLRAWIARAVARWGRGLDVVGDASADSFPASDAPSWTPTSGAKKPAAAHGHP